MGISSAATQACLRLISNYYLVLVLETSCKTLFKQQLISTNLDYNGSISAGLSNFMVILPVNSAGKF